MKSHTDLIQQYLNEALKYYSKTELAQRLGTDQSTIRRWVAGETEPKPYVVDSLKHLLQPFGPQTHSGEFRFIDLFAGIGGIRKAFEHIGGECVFTSEWDSYAQKTYAANFRDGHELNGDITQVSATDIPNHDVLLAGFPCQPFSIAGVSKKNALGRAHGFADETQGTLFFDVARILQTKRPRAFLLENVKNLMSHDKGRTFDVIRRTLTEDLGYHIHYRILDAQHFVPQHRERIVIVGFRDATPFNWDDVFLPPKGTKTMKDILHRTDGSEPYLVQDGNRYFDHDNRQVNSKYTLTPKLWQYLQNYAEKHRAKGNGFGFGLVGQESVARTLSARYYKDGSEILIEQGPGKNPRRLTPRECARLMGLDDTFVIPVSDTRAYKQFGNSVVMPVFKAVANAMRPFILEQSFQPVIPDMWNTETTAIDHKESEAVYAVR
ncbi:DNA cytosine methylase [Pseudogulbenkiania sp. NH8B]|uniref:DNA (cytosine-5-)-methyltransferase n=1 Tax=Pseudogulbenkiania sp. (strain NH8B) TaxID=748280 RepID=UPI00022796F3|nr:DNA (cytosine-5-)-methyltransferase [Pseudogulbenkiania sp. NH8B]BAK74860.1 DNA cytosine methylase [Pseudogulbenkiania sp. NH8B]